MVLVVVVVAPAAIFSVIVTAIKSKETNEKTKQSSTKHLPLNKHTKKREQL